jgi:Flp pilus assembly protein protease CpaA
MVPVWGATPFVLVLLMAATVSDLRRRQVPAWLTFGGIGVGALIATFSGWDALRVSLIGGLVGGMVLIPFVVIRAFGLADALLLAAVGAWYGAEFALRTAWWAALVGALLAMIAWWRGERVFPYVPAIALGALLAFLIS